MIKIYYGLELEVCQSETSSGNFFYHFEDCYISADQSSVTGWDVEVEGRPENFEVFILPEGYIDQIASSMSLKLRKRVGKLFNGRGEELVHQNLQSTLSQFLNYLNKVKELSIKPVYLITHGLLDIPNLQPVDCIRQLPTQMQTS